jgi:hypothetical protein
MVVPSDLAGLAKIQYPTGKITKAKRTRGMA